jgi:hypothetical protein
VIGSGLVGGAAGDFAAQTVQIGMGDRSSYSGQQIAFSSLLSGGIGYGVNRLLAPNLLSGNIGIRQLGNLGEAQAVDELGNTVAGQQIRFQTPGGNPTLDILASDASTPSGFRGVEVKVGDATLTNPQEFGYPELQAGNASPFGTAAQEAGLPVGQPLAPTPVDVWRYQPYELLPFSPGAGAAVGAGVTTAGNQVLPDGTVFQWDLLGKYVKPR